MKAPIMPDVLYADIRNQDEPAAVPAFRIGFVLDGMLDQMPVRQAALAMLDAFASYCGARLGFMMLAGTGGKPGKLIPFRTAKLAEWRGRVVEGLPRNRGLRLYGPDDGPLGAPFLPFFSLDHDRHPSTRIEICLPCDAPDLLLFSRHIDQIARGAPVRFGFQGYGFAGSPVAGVPDRMLPPAFLRYRMALMGDVLGKETCLFYSQPFVTMRRLDQQRKKTGGAPWDYQPGIPDMGWRTYVGPDFAARLDMGKAPQAAGLRIEEQGGMVIVTAGDAPGWGDLNRDEDMSAARAAHAFLRPAYCSRNPLAALTLGADPADPASAERADNYLNRFA